MSFETDYFSQVYVNSREQFRQRSRAVGDPWTIKAHLHQIASVSDSDLTIDSTFLSRTNSRNLFILSSGVHGLEGPVGSGIQHWFLHQCLAKVPKTTDVLLLHALNPWGYKNYRRVTENNIDLNRGFALTPDLFKLPNDDYRIIAPIVEPRGHVRSHSLLFALFYFRIIRLGLKYGGARIMQANVAGQSFSPTGIEFRGQDFEPAAIFLRDTFMHYLPLYENVIYLDLHSGFGERYQLHLIESGKPDPASLAFQQDAFPKRPDVYDIASQFDEGFYYTEGDSVDLFYRCVRSLQGATGSKLRRGAGITLEYGTLGRSNFQLIDSLFRLVQENQGYFHGYVDESSRRDIQNRSREMYFPQERQWQINLLEKARYVIDHALAKLA